MLGLVMPAADFACWGACFFWMYRISKRQNITLAELKHMTKRIERLAKEEHQLIHELHPTVGEIKHAVGNMEEAVAAQNAETKVQEGAKSRPREEQRV